MVAHEADWQTMTDHPCLASEFMHNNDSAVDEYTPVSSQPGWQDLFDNATRADEFGGLTHDCNFTARQFNCQDSNSAAGSRPTRKVDSERCRRYSRSPTRESQEDDGRCESPTARLRIIERACQALTEEAVALAGQSQLQQAQQAQQQQQQLSNIPYDELLARTLRSELRTAVADQEKRLANTLQKGLQEIINVVMMCVKEAKWAQGQVQSLLPRVQALENSQQEAINSLTPQTRNHNGFDPPSKQPVQDVLQALQEHVENAKCISHKMKEGLTETCTVNGQQQQQQQQQQVQSHPRSHSQSPKSPVKQTRAGLSLQLLQPQHLQTQPVQSLPPQLQIPTLRSSACNMQQGFGLPCSPTAVPREASMISREACSCSAKPGVQPQTAQPQGVGSSVQFQPGSQSVMPSPPDIPVNVQQLRRGHSPAMRMRSCGDGQQKQQLHMQQQLQLPIQPQQSQQQTSGWLPQDIGSPLQTQCRAPLCTPTRLPAGIPDASNSQCPNPPWASLSAAALGHQTMLNKLPQWCGPHTSPG